MRLRTMQFKAANSGSGSMLIWLGKQILGQKDQQEIVTIDEEEKRLTDDEVDEMLQRITGNDSFQEKNSTRSTGE